MVEGRGRSQMERVREQPKSHHRPRAEAIEEGSVEHGVDAADLERELDELLDEVDAVLEENAEEFVKAYVQKGGE
jgi:ubiquitin-like protein Pup